MASTKKTTKITKFEQSIRVNVPGDHIFDFLADGRNVSQDLPTVKNTQPQQVHQAD